MLVDIIEHEKNRQWKGLELIPSENFVSSSVMEAVGSVMTNKYSEGYPGESLLWGGGVCWLGGGAAGRKRVVARTVAHTVCLFVLDTRCVCVV